jgi:hypothetical protein
MNGLSFMGDNLMFAVFSAKILLNQEKSGMSANVKSSCAS